MCLDERRFDSSPWRLRSLGSVDSGPVAREASVDPFHKVRPRSRGLTLPSRGWRYRTFSACKEVEGI